MMAQLHLIDMDTSRSFAVPTFIKWAGGKSSLLPKYASLFPDPLPKRYFEPFLGSGAVFFYLQSNYALEEAILSDYNEDLIDLFAVVKENPHHLMEVLSVHTRAYNGEEYYYKVREQDPTLLSPVERAARFIFLNKVGFNGLYRENRRSEFNVPWGQYDRLPRLFDSEQLLAAHRYLKKATLRWSPYQEIIRHVRPGDFVYFDPPYAPLNATSSFTGYMPGGFDIEDQQELARIIHELDELGAFVMLSNSNAPLIHELYADFGFIVTPVSARRSINRNGDGRAPIDELVIRNYPRTVSSMPSKTHSIWQTLIQNGSVNLAKDVSIVTASQIKQLGEEPRNIAYLDEQAKLPPELRKGGMFVLPINNGTYAVVRGKGYQELEPVSTPPKEFVSKLPFELLSHDFGTGEFQSVYYAHNCGLLEHFVEGGRLFPQIGGRKASMPFSFKIDGHASLEVSGVQTEVDAGFEGENITVLVEAKSGPRTDFIIRQLYYPYRIWREVTKKETISLFFQYDLSAKVYTLRQYRFQDPLDYESIELVRAERYQLAKAQPKPADESYWNAVLSAPAVPATHTHEMPQADSVERLLAFPFFVQQGCNTSELMAQAQRFTVRQSSYYRQAMELLGFVERRKGNKYELTQLGQQYVNLDAPQRNEIMMRRMFTLPVMQEVLLQLLLRSTHSLTIEELNHLVRVYAQKIGASTVGRRGDTIRAYLRWIGQNVGALSVDRQGTVSLPFWQRGLFNDM